jgi:hypothetical protein
MTLLNVFAREVGRFARITPACWTVSADDAGIATRRIREVLPLTHQWQRREHVYHLYGVVKRLGRCLGRVRDVSTARS